MLCLGAGYVFLKSTPLRRQLLQSKLVWLIGAYTFVEIIWGVVSWRLHDVSTKALGYGLIVNVRFLLWFLVVWIIASQAPVLRKRWPDLVFWPAAVVVVFGLLQYFVLPYDVMRHVGYGAHTIFPYETINHDIHHLRIMSTLRGANPLGAYLVVVIPLLVSMWFTDKRRRLLYGVLGAASAAALVLTFSRSAWIGVVVALALLLWRQLKTKRTQQIALAVVGGCAVVALGIFIAFRNNTSFQDAIFHTNAHSMITSTSDQGHASALKGGLTDMLHQPLGRGPGTAGPASVYNNHPARIAENYFIQVGQEVGWLGLALFMAINVGVGILLWSRRSKPLALGLLAALIGVSIVSLLSHAWTDDTLAYIWWGLAGLAIAHPASRNSVATSKR